MEQTYRTMNEHITPGPELKRAVLEKAAPRRPLRLRPAVALVLVLALALSAPQALANPDIYQLMHNLSAQTAARFAPVQESCETNGIRIEVVSASVHGKSAEIYLTMEDMEASRLAPGTYPEVTEIFGLANYGCSLKNVGFDDETGRVTLLLDYETLYEDFGDALWGSKVTLYLDRLSTFTGSAEHPVPIVLTDSGTTTLALRQVNPDGSLTEDGNAEFDLSGYDGYYRNKTQIELLRPLDAGQTITDGISMTGLAYIGDELHIQTMVQTDAPDDHPSYSLYLVDGAGNELHPERFLTFIPEQAERYVQYEEDVFLIDPQTLASCTLMVRVNGHAVIEGPWRITFDLDEVRSTYHDPDDDIEKVTQPTE